MERVEGTACTWVRLGTKVNTLLRVTQAQLMGMSLPRARPVSLELSGYGAATGGGTTMLQYRGCGGLSVRADTPYAKSDAVEVCTSMYVYMCEW